MRQYCIVNRASQRYSSLTRPQVVANIIDYDDDTRFLLGFYRGGRRGAKQAQQTQDAQPQLCNFADGGTP